MGESVVEIILTDESFIMAECVLEIILTDENFIMGEFDAFLLLDVMDCVGDAVCIRRQTRGGANSLNSVGALLPIVSNAVRCLLS